MNNIIEPLKAQDAVFTNSGTFSATNFMQLSPGFPLSTASSTGIKLGFNYSPLSHRMNVYGGGYRNSWHINGIGKPYQTWQEQMLFNLYKPNYAPPTLFNPGIRYLANRHNWGGYQAVFGLKERVSDFSLMNPDESTFSYVENNEPKDAVISFSYPYSTPETHKPRLIFETVELDTVYGSTAPGDMQTELATLTHNGNLGFRTSNPAARIEINGLGGLTTNSNGIGQAISILNGNNAQNFILTTAAGGSLMGFGTNEPEAKIDIRGNGSLIHNVNVKPKILSVYDDNNEEKVVIHNGYTYTVNNNSFYKPASLWLNKPTTNASEVEFFVHGSSILETPIVNNGSQNISGTDFILDGSGIYLNTHFANNMKVEVTNGFRITDNNYSYFTTLNGGIYMDILKTVSGLSYLTINSSGQIEKSTSFPNPNKAWSYEGNIYTGYTDLILGTLAGSTKSAINIVHNGDYIGRFDVKAQAYNSWPTTHNTGELSYKGHITVGGMATSQYPPQGGVNDFVTMTLIGTNKWTDMYQPPGAFDWQTGGLLIQGFKPLVDLNMMQTGTVNTFNVFQNGMVEIGELDKSTSSSGGASFSNPIRYNSVLAVGGVGTNHIIKYAIATYNNANYTAVNFGIGYNSPLIYLGKSEVKDVSGTSGPEKLEFKANLIPKTSGTYDIGEVAGKRWRDIYLTGTVTSSDKRLKKDINILGYGLKEVLKLNPVSYHLIDYSTNNNLRFGFIAQELQEVLPNSIVVGKESDSTYLGVRYDEIIPVLTKAIQEQQIIIENQQREIEIIKAKVPGNGIFSTGSTNGIMNKEPILFQNSPNPFSDYTNIDYFIPENTTQASITITDAAGKLVYSYTINTTGMGRVALKDESIAQGNYYYSLYANGRLIDTKQLSVVKN